MKHHAPLRMFLLSRWVTALALVALLLTGCAEDKRIPVPIKIDTLSISLYSSYNQISQYFSDKNIDIMVDDSNNLKASGIDLYYFGTENGMIKYYTELYFIDDELNGIKLTMYSVKVKDDEFYVKLNQNKKYFSTIVKSNPDLYLDTLKVQSRYNKFTFFVKSRDLQEKIM